jgi:hypothetical protein
VTRLSHGRSWYPYLRGGDALSLRVATGPAESDALGYGIELVAADESIKAMLRDVLSNKALEPTSRRAEVLGGHRAVVVDVRVTRRGSLDAPPSLSGEQVDPGEGLRVYVFRGSEEAFAALVIADHSRDLATIERLARPVLASIR